MKLFKTQSLLAAATAILVGHAASAAVVVEETFTYADGAVEALNGGTGFSGAWGAVVGDTTPGNGTSQFNVASNQAIFNGNSAGQHVITQSRDFTSAVTVTVTNTVTVDIDLIIATGDNQAGRGMGVNFTSGGAIVFTLGKRINGNQALLDNGIPSGSNDLAVVQPGGTIGTHNLTATFTYDGSDTAVSVTNNVDPAVNYTFVGQQISFDGVQLTGYHQSTLNNGIDNIVVDVSPVPEPGSLALLALGGLMIARRRRA